MARSVMASRQITQMSCGGGRRGGYGGGAGASVDAGFSFDEEAKRGIVVMLSCFHARPKDGERGCGACWTCCNYAGRHIGCTLRAVPL
jgi:hypothetical protein